MSTYSSSQLGSLNGELIFGNSVVPYIGFGSGNPAGEDARIHFLFDVGTIYGGTSSVSLTDILQWYAVRSLGALIRF